MREVTKIEKYFLLRGRPRGSRAHPSRLIGPSVGSEGRPPLVAIVVRGPRRPRFIVAQQGSVNSPLGRVKEGESRGVSVARACLHQKGARAVTRLQGSPTLSLSPLHPVEDPSPDFSFRFPSRATPPLIGPSVRGEGRRGGSCSHSPFDFAFPRSLDGRGKIPFPRTLRSSLARPSEFPHRGASQIDDRTRGIAGARRSGQGDQRLR